MIQSMTGYGRGAAEYNGTEIIIELRSVNRSSLETSVRFPQDYQFLETKIKKTVQARLHRGNVNVSIQKSQKTQKANFKINEELAGEIYKVFSGLKDKLGMDCGISFGDIVRIEGVIVQETGTDEDQEALTSAVEEALNEALDNLIAMRLEEGKFLHKDLLNRVEAINEILNKIIESAPELVKKYGKKLEEKMKNLLPVDMEIDKARFYTELAIVAERSDVTEELVRLGSHIKLFTDTLGKNESIGKKLDFILQEMNREANTIASKVSDFDITKEVIGIKNEVEKIREQVQNVE